MKKRNELVCALFILMGTHAVQAEIHSNQSGPLTTMEVGASDPIQRGDHQMPGGAPGVGISTVGGGKKIGFASLTSPRMSGGADTHGVYTIQPNANSPSSHSNMGVFHFAKITDANVYFGDWAKTTSATDATHQTYYVGKDVTTTLPTDSATYTVTGMSQYTGSNLLSGTFGVDFSQKKIEGSLVNSQRTVELEGGNLYTANNQVTFSANAKEGTTSGIVEGAFFGESAEALAGIVVFSSDHTKDIGFGGTKNSSESEETTASTDAS